MIKFFANIITLVALTLPCFVMAETATEAWDSLIAKNFKKRPEFQFIQNNRTLPNVLLYGDSISIHYTQAVREKLSDKANVYRLYRNGSDSGGFISKMDKMHDKMTNEKLEQHWDFSWDVIHFNVGLHDLKYVKGRKLDKENGKLVSTTEQYQKNLINIINYLKKSSPKAQLIFATTTPVPEGALGRFAGDSIKYNEAALEVLKSYPDIRINDLYTLTKPNQEKWWIKPGDVHYNKQGSTAQGTEVAKIITKALHLKK